MGPGPPPLGPWGGSLGGGPDPMSEAQNLAGPLGFGIVFYVDFDIDFGCVVRVVLGKVTLVVWAGTPPQGAPGRRPRDPGEHPCVPIKS